MKSNLNMLKMRIKEILQKKGITQKDFAKILGMTPVGLSLAISDNGNPSLNRLQQIANALGVSIAELFTDSADPQKIVAFIHYNGTGHTPTTLDEIMAVLKNWNEEEFHKVCHSITFNHIRDKYEDDIVIQELLVSLCSLLHNYGHPNYLREKKHTKDGNAK